MRALLYVCDCGFVWMACWSCTRSLNFEYAISFSPANSTAQTPCIVFEFRFKHFMVFPIIVSFMVQFLDDKMHWRLTLAKSTIKFHDEIYGKQKETEKLPSKAKWIEAPEPSTCCENDTSDDNEQQPTPPPSHQQ